MLTRIEERALLYVRNAGEGATVGNFIEDHEPIGRQVLDSLVKKSCVHVCNGQISLNEPPAPADNPPAPADSNAPEVG